jgi:hypothetical protein
MRFDSEHSFTTPPCPDFQMRSATSHIDHVKERMSFFSNSINVLVHHQRTPENIMYYEYITYFSLVTIQFSEMEIC